MNGTLPLSPVAWRVGAALLLSAALHGAGLEWFAESGNLTSAGRPGELALPNVTVHLADVSVAPAALPSPANPAPMVAPIEPAAPPVPSEAPAPLPDRVAEGEGNSTVFLPPSTVDSRAHPINFPDLSILAGVPGYSGDAVRLRLYVDASGHLVKSEILYARDGDRELAVRLADALVHTEFAPARRGASDVSSYVDVDIALTDERGRALSK